MTRRRLSTALVVAALALAGVNAGCREEGPAERLGRAIDDSASELAESVGDELDDALDAAGEAAEDARERVRKGVDEATR